MLHEKQIRAIFFLFFFSRFSYSSSKWVIKQQRQLATTTTHLTQELLINVQCSGGSRSFAKETRALKMGSIVASHWKLTSMQQQWPTERIIKAHPFITTQGVAKELNVNHSTVQHSKQTGKVEKLNKWVSHEQTENKKNSHFQVSSSLTLCTDCDMWWKVDFMWQPVAASLVAGPRSYTAKPKVHQKKVIVTVWWSAACLIHYSFLNLGETIISEKYAQQINDMHWKLRHLQPALVNRKRPILLQDNARPHVTQPALQKFNELGNKVLPHPPHSPDLIQLTTTSSSISTTFGRENASTTSGRQKMLSKSLLNSKSQIFTL